MNYENNLTYTYYINLVAARIRQQKFLLTWRELLTLAPSSFKVSFKCCCQVDSWLLIKNFEHSCDQLLSEWYFREKNITTEVVFIQLLSYNVVSKQKNIKMKTQNSTAYSYHSKVTSTQNKGASFFSCFGHGV